MRILAYAPQMASFGGMERHICLLAAALGQRGHAVTLLTTSNSLGPELRATLTAGGVTLRELARQRGRAGRLLKALWLWREVCRLRSSTWDLVYTNGQSGLAQFVWRVARPTTRIVHHHHTAADEGEQATWSPRFRRALHKAPEIVACSRFTQQQINRAVSRDDVRFLPYLTACPVDQKDVADRTYSAAAPLHFGFTGRLVAEKGIDLIIALARAGQPVNVTWHLHGSGPDYPPQRFAGLPHLVYHGPYANRQEHARALLALDALVLFSRHNEGMPLSLIEGMSAGLPWVATDRGGTREIAVSADDCLVLPEAQPEALAPALETMGRRLRGSLTSRRRQRQAYDRHFSPEVVSAAWARYFEGSAR